MPTLSLQKTPPSYPVTQRHFPIGENPVVIGRLKTCDVFLEPDAVSRKHAAITFDKGIYYLEDLNSRNDTYLNNRKLEPGLRTVLKHKDRIRICDFTFLFETSAEEDDGVSFSLFEEDPNTTSTVQATVARPHGPQLLETQPNDKLRALIRITTSLGKKLRMDQLLPQIADTLLELFKQADRCFIILYDPENEQLIPKVARSRRATSTLERFDRAGHGIEPAEGTHSLVLNEERFSKTIIREVITTEQAILSQDATADTQFSPSQSISNLSIRSVMCAPVLDSARRPFGVIQLDTQAHSKTFSQEDLQFLSAVASQAAVAMENVRMHEEIVHRENQRKEFELAQTVQRSFLPRELPAFPGYDFFSHYEAAEYVGGDFYDFIPLDEHRLAIVLCDVSGHGVPAALMVARLSLEVRLATLAHPNDPGAAITQLNEQLIRLNIPDRFVTMIAAVLDTHSHEVIIANAGHERPICIRPSQGTLDPAVTEGICNFPLCWVPNHPYQAVRVVLQPGESIVLYTDGVTDATNPSGERFGKDRLLRNLEEAALLDSVLGTDRLWPQPNTICDRLLDALQVHSAGQPQFDDIALVCFGRVPRSLSDGPQTRPIPPIE